MPGWQEQEAERRWLHEQRRRAGHHHQQRSQQPRQPMRLLTDIGGDRDADLFEDLYFYTFVFGSIAAAAVATATVTIQADSKFEWMRTTATGNKNGLAEPWPDTNMIPVSVLITDTGSGRQLMSVATPLSLLSGKGSLPFINPAARIFQPSATVQMSATNYGGSTYDNVQVCFIGRKIFKGTPGA